MRILFRSPVQQILQDLSFAFRTLRRSPAFATVAILTLAIGIGASTAIFSFVDGVLLKPLPYANADRIVRVLEKPPGDADARNGISTLNFLDWQQQNTVFEYMAARTGGSVTLTGVATPIQFRGARMSAHGFDILGVHAVLGRTFAPDEDQLGKDRVAVLSNALWKSQFGADRDIIGRAIQLTVSRRRNRSPPRRRRLRSFLCPDLPAAGIRAAEHDTQLPLVRSNGAPQTRRDDREGAR